MFRRVYIALFIVFYFVPESRGNEIIDALYIWQAKGEELRCVMIREHQDDDAAFVVERISSNGKPVELLRHSPGSFPYWIAGHGGYAVATWRSATAFIVYVYEFDGEKVKEAFEGGIHIEPEMTHYGPEATPAIIIAEEVSDSTKDYIHEPVTASVYLLKESGIIHIKGIPWFSRHGLDKNIEAPMKTSPN